MSGLWKANMKKIFSSQIMVLHCMVSLLVKIIHRLQFYVGAVKQCVFIPTDGGSS